MDIEKITEITGPQFSDMALALFVICDALKAQPGFDARAFQ